MARLARDPAVRLAAVIVVALRAVLALAGWAAVRFLPAAPPGGEWSGLRADDGAPLWWLVAPWQRWDALWYQHIAADGYRSGAPDAAFYPLYPVLTRVTGAVLGIGVARAALIVGTLACFAALVLLHRLVEGDLGSDAAGRAVVYAALLPTAFFLLAPFAESLFLALSVGAVLAARRRRFALAGLVAAAAALTRPTGILLAVPLAVEAALDVRDRQARREPGVRPGHLAAVLPIVTTALYGLYATRALGVAGGPWAAEDHWGTHLAWPWAAAWDSLHTVAGDPVEIVNLLAVVGLLVAVPLMVVVRLPPSYIAYAAASAIPVCFHETAGRLQSSARFLAVVFPVYALLATQTAAPRWHRALAAAMSAGMAVLFVHFARGSFVG